MYIYVTLLGVLTSRCKLVYIYITIVRITSY
jgi:hypothetical protein